MFTPNPVETFLRHAKSDNNVHMIAIILISRIFQGGRYPVTFSRIVIYKIGNFKDITF
ncbi:hypothetical protein D1872_223560 [compost metagenome]